MYTKDKSHRITLRLNEEQHEFVLLNAETLGVSPSDFLRMVINAALATSRRLDAAQADAIERLEREDKERDREERQGRENDKADKHDFV